MRQLAILAAAIGLTGCAVPVSDSAICAGLGNHVSDLRRGLEGHPETPDAVGEPATNVVLGFEAGCNR